MLKEIPKRRGGRDHKSDEEAAAHDLTVFTKVDDAREHAPRNGDA